MKLFEVLSIQNFYNLVLNAKLPIKTTYKLTRLMRRVEEEAKFYQAEFTKIVNEYALRENGELVYSDDMTSIKIIEGKEEECASKILELKNLEIDLSEFHFSIEEFDNIELSINDMYGILPLIND